MHTIKSGEKNSRQPFHHHKPSSQKVNAFEPNGRKQQAPPVSPLFPESAFSALIPELQHAVAAKKYELQLALYAKALRDITSMPVKEKYIYFLAVNDAVPV